jgi:hypothetical protein
MRKWDGRKEAQAAQKKTGDGGGIGVRWAVGGGTGMGELNV